MPLLSEKTTYVYIYAQATKAMRLRPSPSRFTSGAGRIPTQPPYWERFELPYRPNLNIISCLMEIQKNPVTKEGTPTTPPVWQMNCLEQVCGICTMVINGRARQSCSALDRQPRTANQARADAEVSQHPRSGCRSLADV